MISPEKLDVIIYDFDGVMTDNRVLVFQDGREAVFASRADGLGVSIIKAMGITQMIISTEANPVVQARAEKLKIHAITNCEDKKKALLDFCQEKAVDADRVLFVGNDINDLDAMNCVGYAVAPADAHDRIKSMADLILSSNGGEGVVRELADLLTKTNKI